MVYTAQTTTFGTRSSLKKVMACLCAMLLLAWGNVWAANVKGTVQNIQYHYTEKVELNGDWTITGSNTVITITGNLDLNYHALTVSDGATLIVEGSVENSIRLLGSDASITVNNATLIIKKNLNGAGSITVNGENSNFAVIEDYTVILFVPHGNATGEDNIYVGSSLLYSKEASQAYNNAWKTIEEYATLLPITLNYFVANQDGDEVAFEWQTSSEVNNDFFIVEYSIDGVHFKELLREDGNGTTSETNNYYVTASAEDFSGITYFRLKQTDFNGEYSYSSVISLMVEAEETNVYVYPNPATEFVSVSGTYNSALVKDVFGKTVLQASNNEQIYVGNLSAGTYYVVITTANGKKVLPFVKK